MSALVINMTGATRYPVKLRDNTFETLNEAVASISASMTSGVPFVVETTFGETLLINPRNVAAVKIPTGTETVGKAGGDANPTAVR